MPSFDIVSKVNPMEIENAVNQARKELANRFDFKGSQAKIELEKDEIKLSAEDAYMLCSLAADLKILQVVAPPTYNVGLALPLDVFSDA